MAIKCGLIFLVNWLNPIPNYFVEPIKFPWQINSIWDDNFDASFDAHRRQSIQTGRSEYPGIRVDQILQWD
jgi:enamine deaminase RidA (YjgF/YER057c/UK114 family)